MDGDNKNTLLINPKDSEIAVLRLLNELLCQQKNAIENIRRVEISSVKEDKDGSFRCIRFSENMVSDVLRTFHHLSSKRIVWQKLLFKKFDQRDPQFQFLLSGICKLDIFREIELDQGEFDAGSSFTLLTEQTMEDICYAVQTNSNFERLSFEKVIVSPVAASILLGALKTANPNFKDLSIAITELDDLYSREPPPDPDTSTYLADGLRNNKTLQRFSLKFCQVSDDGVSKILKSLIGHPTLQHLVLEDTCHHRTSKSTKSLVSLLKSAWTMPNLKHLDMWMNQISYFPRMDASDFANFRNSNLRSLNLSKNPIVERCSKSDQLALLSLVQNAPRLGAICDPWATETSPLVTPLAKYIMDWNHCGGRLLLKAPGVEDPLPLSMWPHIFERTHTILDVAKNNWTAKGLYSPDRLPSVYYNLVHTLLSHNYGVLPPPIHEVSERRENRQTIF